MFCGDPDGYDKKHPSRTSHLRLCAAGSRSASSDHVDSVTKHIRAMAIELEDSKVLSILNAGDVRAVECYYHKICMTNFENKVKLKRSKVTVTSMQEDQISVAEVSCAFFCFCFLVNIPKYFDCTVRSETDCTCNMTIDIDIQVYILL